MAEKRITAFLFIRVPEKPETMDKFSLFCRLLLK